MATTPVRPTNGRRIVRSRAGLLMRSVPLLLGVAALAGACGSGGSTTSAASSTVAPTTTVFRQPGDPSLEICAPAAVDKIDGQLTSGKVVGTPVRTATSTSTTCTYRLDQGSLRMRVEVSATVGEARERFTQHVRKAGPVARVPNLGDAAFSDRTGSTVTQKGSVVLTIDVTEVPVANDRTQVAQSLSFQILTTFNG